MSEMVERVAKAQWNKFNSEFRAGKLGPWESQNDAIRHMWRTIAAHGIKTMRKYTEEMSLRGGSTLEQQYGSHVSIGQSAAERCWLTMINTALK